MKINLDLTKIGKASLNFVKENPVLCIGTVVIGYITLRDNDLVKETINRMK